MTKPINETPFSPMVGTSVPIFPISLYRSTINLNHDLIAQACRDIVEPIKRQDNNIKTQYTTYFSKEAQEYTEQREWFKDFSDIIKDSYVDWLSNEMNIDFSELSRHDIHFFAWLNVYNAPHQHDSHNHPDSLISGTYYVKVDKKSTPIKFYNPNSASACFPMGRDQQYDGQDNMNGMVISGFGHHQHEVFVHPVKGEVLMWPSYLNHMVPQYEGEQEEDYERITISFNLYHNRPITNNTTGRDLDYKFLRK